MGLAPLAPLAPREGGALAPLQELSRRERKAVLVEAREALRAERPETRRAAVRRLVGLGGAEAWELVLTALADPDAKVGDAAQNALAASTEEAARDGLLGSAGLGAREEVARRRAAEALGRTKLVIDGELLAGALSTGDAETSRLVLWSLERLARAERLGGRREKTADRVLALVRQRRDVALAARALVTLATLGHEDLDELVREAARRRAPEPRSAALLAARRAGLSGTFELARGLVDDEVSDVRAQAIDALADLDTRAALLVLVGRLEEEPRVGLRWRLLEALRRRTGLHHRFDPRPWRLFVEGLPETGRASDHARRSSAPAGGGSRAEALRLPTDSDRVAFLFDFSGSMWTPLGDGRTPKDVVAKSLRTALEGLDESAEFNLIPYAHDPIPWSKGLVRARPARVREALEFFDRCQARGKGNVYDAARLALADPAVDRLVILTDGVPTGGTHSDLDLVVALLAEFDLLRCVAIDAVLVDAPRGSVRRWSELAARTGGRVLEVALE